MFNCQNCSHVDKCHECDALSNRFLDSDQNCTCLSGFHEDNITLLNAQCVSCGVTISDCTNCELDYQTSLVMCTQCDPGFYIMPDGSCASDCGDRLYENDTDFTCYPCFYTCLQCDNPNTCLACDNTNDFRSENQGACECDAAYH